MRTITAIKPQTKDAKRCNIYLDGEFFCGMDFATAVKNRLKVGMNVKEEALAAIQAESDRAYAMDKAMSFLSGGVKTQKQVKDFLAEKGFTRPLIGEVIEKLVEYGFIDDGDYARRYAESYADKKGARLIKLELQRKGVSEESADVALGGIVDQRDAAMSIAQKYMRGKPSDQKTIQKLYRHLMSKGFEYDDVRFVLDEFRSEDF